ncbi:MAG: cyclic peptide export ABC transporter [Deltaproteobacteria bacterium]|nr:cyclic peptide export ABC transporter [Deltaproteobacteria bacterium]
MIDLLERIPLVAFVQHYCKFLNRKFFLLNLLSGLSSTAIVALVNNSAAKKNVSTFDLSSFLIFAIILICYIVTTKTLMNITFEITEDSVDSVRKSLFKKLRLCDLEFFEQRNRNTIYDQIMKSTATIAQTGAFILATGPELILIVMVYIYIFFLSKTAFFIAIGMLMSASFIFIKKTNEVEKYFLEAAGHDQQVGNFLSGLLFGFKECLLNSRRDTDLASEFSASSNNLADSRILAGKNFSNIYAFVQIFFYVLLAIIVFLMPVLGWHNSDDQMMTFKLVAAIFFVFIPTANVVRMINYNTQVSVAISGIRKLENFIDERLRENGIKVDSDKDEIYNPPVFASLELKDIEYSYYDADRMATFSVGPVSFRLNKGDVVFICGRNGSGKTTFLKLLAGLYKPQKGEIKENERTVPFNSNQVYRETFAAVFSDFHLFQKLHGLHETDPGKTAELLTLFQLDYKTKRIGDSFSNLDLSTGQRKRLALIVSLMEDKPVYIFDEWAADQDPHFREYFYLELLPRLKREGKTIVAVTHDDRYFDCCDRILWFQDDGIVETESNIEP